MSGENGSVRSLAGKRTRLKRLLRRKYRRAPLATSSYLRLLLERHGEGVLHVFNCYGCGQKALDPIGRTSKRQWLCDSCSS
jgi:hypothetical protein